MGQKDMMTAQEAASELGYSRRHVYRLLKEGIIEGEHFGNAWMIDRAEVERIKRLQDVHGRLPPSE